MKNLCLTVLLTMLTSGAMLAACSDDPSGTDQASGGAGGADGNEAGTPSAGKATGGKATGGTATGGKATGGSNTGGTDAGAPAVGGAGGEMTGEGGAAGEPALVGGAGGEAAGGAPGAGGGGPEVVYLCNDITQSHKLCSAFKAAACVPATDCADCVTTRNSEHEPFEDCAACQAEYDAFEQCGIDALESGNLASGVECVEDYGADLHFENCYPMLESALQCQGYTVENPCPASWPL